MKASQTAVLAACLSSQVPQRQAAGPSMVETRNVEPHGGCHGQLDDCCSGGCRRGRVVASRSGQVQRAQLLQAACLAAAVQTH